MTYLGYLSSIFRLRTLFDMKIGTRSDYYAGLISPRLNELQHKDGHNYNEEYAKRDHA